LKIPLENKLAKSDYAQAKIQQSQAVTEIKLKEVTIINEVRDAVREVETNIQRLATARAILKFSQETLAAEKRNMMWACPRSVMCWTFRTGCKRP